MLDCLIVGAGPAGLTAAVYLARFRRDVLLADSGASRARWIPVSQNTPGFPGGIHGETLLAELREQAARFGVEPRPCKVRKLERDGDAFVATIDRQRVEAARVILATGVVDGLPPIDGVEAAIKAGVVRLCAVCDGLETDGMRVGVYGPPESAARHAKYMRTFCTDVTAIATRGEFAPSCIDELDALGIARIDDVEALVWDGGKRLCVRRCDGDEAGFTAFYPVLGAAAQSQLAIDLGAECSDEGDLVVDDHQRTTVPGLYAIGDVVSALNQISVGVGHAAIAATDIHNALPHRPREESSP
jgi:thioredoxin reductase (NADPH)